MFLSERAEQPREPLSEFHARLPVEELSSAGAIADEARDVEVAAEVYRIDRVVPAAKEFQEHTLMTVDVTAQQRKINAKNGMLVVRCGQRLGTLAAYLLEPQSEDGLWAWNFFDESLKQGADFPVIRLPAAAELVLR